jgi:hypothetical protein
MAIPNNYPLYQVRMDTTTNSIASTPLACAVVAPFRGRITQITAVAHGAFTTNCSIAVAIISAPAAGAAPGSGTAVTGSPMTLTASNSAAGTTTTMVPTGANIVNEGDIIVFTPSGSTGTTIGGTFCAYIVPA